MFEKLLGTNKPSFDNINKLVAKRAKITSDINDMCNQLITDNENSIELHQNIIRDLQTQIDIVEDIMVTL